jgi:hypothetical protein
MFIHITSGTNQFEVPSFDFSRQPPRPDKRGVPRFADADGNLFDASYYETKSTRGKVDALEDSFLKTVPDPSAFQTYAEYEQALKEWKDRVEAALGSLQLPIPMGRCLYRPRMGQSARSASFGFRAGRYGSAKYFELLIPKCHLNIKCHLM